MRSEGKGHPFWPALPFFIFYFVFSLQPRPTFGSSADFPRLQSLYVPMRDGIKIAIDVWLPAGLSGGRRIPTLMRATRYWRSQDIVDTSFENASNYKTAQLFNGAGYALVLVDARGTGASFGSRAYEMTEDEVKDYGQIADWIIAQPWSNQKVGAFGVSYEGNTAEMLVVNRRPFVKAVAPLFNDFNYIDYLAYPGGLFLNFYTSLWGNMVGAMDRNEICGLAGVAGGQCEELRQKVRGVKPVDSDQDRTLLAAAVEQHKANVKVAEAAEQVEFKDDPFGPDRIKNLPEIANPSGHLKEIEAAGTAMFIRVGWLDAATVSGTLCRFLTIRNPQKIIIGPWSHGGRFDTDPFLPSATPAQPSPADQTTEMIQFFDLYLKEIPPPKIESSIKYYTLGAGTWGETRVWPPGGFTSNTFYLGPENTLSYAPSRQDDGRDSYVINYEATTGSANRWHTNIGGGDVIYPDRAEEDKKLLTYTSAPMESDVEITGNPLVTIYVSSTAEDGAFFIYLEDVAPNGRVTYITEGELRALCRKASKDKPPYEMFGPYRTFERKDAGPLIRGEAAELTFGLWPTSVKIKKGNRIRIAVAGADKDNFARYPLQSEKVPTILVERNRRFPSKIVLPIKK
jgi:putative CocE/NonD family hydrolase